jgi:colicin import membrane protein
MKISWLAAGIVALAACSHANSNQPQSEASRAQNQAEQQFQKAADAQKQANDEQAKAEQAQQEVTTLQKQLAEAQAKSDAQTAKAQQAQQEARSAAQDAQQQASQSQQQATQLQTSEAQTRKQMHKQNMEQWTQTQNVQGTALSSSGTSLTVRSQDQGDVKLNLSDATAVTVDGKMGKANQIQPGSDVRASYQTIDGQATALKVDATSKNKQSSSSGSSDQQQK